MTFFYSSTPEPFTGSMDLSKLNGTKGYLRHFDNLMYLSFMSKNGTFRERQQALKEMEICERKLKWWERHPNYIHSDALAGMRKIKDQWAAK